MKKLTKKEKEWVKKHEEEHKKHLQKLIRMGYGHGKTALGPQKKQPVPSEALEYVVNPVFKEV